MWHKEKKKYEYTIKGDSVLINIYQRNGKRHVTFIDRKYLEKFLDFKYSWGVTRLVKNNQWYVVATVYLGMVDGKPRNTRVYLHKYLMGVPKRTYVDHANGNSLDNREYNLRLTTHGINMLNRQGRNKNNKSGYRNVCQVGNQLYVQLQIDGVNTLLKKFPLDQLKEAGKYAEEMRKKYYGEFAGKS